MADTATEIAIATQTLSSAASSITFSSIPATYTDLRLVFLPIATASLSVWTTFNGDTATNYSYTNIYGDGTAAASARSTSRANILLSQNAIATSQYPLLSMDVFSYAGSTNKTVLTTASQDNNGSGISANTVQLWRSTAAITSITLTTSTSTFAIGTTATLYGIL